MHVLTFVSDLEGNEIAVFAESVARAAAIWNAIDKRFWLLPEGWRGPGFDTWQLIGNDGHEEEACARCVEGIGVYDPEAGWTILAVDYSAIGFDPPK